MTIAILGGRFDPPHWGHMLVAQQVLDRRDIDEVWLIPAAQHQWKPTLASADDRLAMLQYLCSERIITSDLEIRRRGISYTIDTLKEIKKEFKHQLYWIIGSDIIQEFHRWEKAGELTNLATFLVFPRDPYALPPKLPKGFELVQGDNLVVTNLSSTVIRQRIKEGKSIAGFVPERVEKYIGDEGLYK